MAHVLFEGDSSGSEEGFSVSNKYAEKYDSWREKEEYQKLQAKYGKDVPLDATAGDDGSSSSSEDEEAAELTPQVERQFFFALSKLKQNDPEIYDPTKCFFNVNKRDTDDTSKKKQRERPMFLRDYEREMLLKTGEIQNCNDGADAAAGPSTGQQPSYMEEQEEIRAGLRSLVADSSDSEDGEGGFSTSLLKRRDKTAEQQKQEDEDYKTWLMGQRDAVDDKAVEGRLKGLKEAWSNPKISKDEAFLRDYILSKRYLGHGDDSYVPSYDEVVHDSEGDLSEDERTVGRQEQFEHKFNFRFEEPDQEFIKRYPRTIRNSLRKKDERRKQSREDKRQRREEERRRKEEELKRLKTLKRKEIMEKLEMLKEAVGNADLPFEMADLDGDFDPETHDRRMAGLFGADYYCDAENDEQKPEFSDDAEDWDSWAPDQEDGEGEEHSREERPGPSHHYGQQDGPACEQPGFVMDCEYRRPPERLAVGRGRRKRRGRLAELLRRQKPRFEPGGHQPLAEYVDQYYRLDEQANPHPFRYRQVAANDFGLDTQEILMADERDLNRWVSVKRMSQYLRPEEEQHDIKKYKAKSTNAFYKQKVLQSLYLREGEQQDDPETYEPQKKKKKKRRKREKEEGYSSGAGEEHRPTEVAAEPGEAAPDPAPHTQPRQKKRPAAEPGEAAPDPAPHTQPGRKKRKGEERAADGASGGHLSATDEDGTAPEQPLQGGKRRTKKRNRGRGAESQAEEAAGADQRPPEDRGGGRRWEGAAQKRRRHRPRPEAGTQAAMVLSMSDARLEAFGLNPKKIRGKVIYGKGGS